MLRFSSLFIAMLLLSTVFLVVPSAGYAQELPKGVAIEVLAEYPSNTPGVEKILFRKITIQPGASWTLTVPAQSLCQGTKGVMEAFNHASGKTTIRNVGDRWATTPNSKMTLSNKGNTVHEHLFYTMVVKK